MIKLGKYRHFKGSEYELIAIAKHSEDLSDMAVYRSLKDGRVWVRPLSMWNEQIIHEGKTVSRFTFIEE